MIEIFLVRMSDSITCRWVRKNVLDVFVLDQAQRKLQASARIHSGRIEVNALKLLAEAGVGGSVY